MIGQLDEEVALGVPLGADVPTAAWQNIYPYVMTHDHRWVRECVGG